MADVPYGFGQLFVQMLFGDLVKIEVTLAQIIIYPAVLSERFLISPKLILLHEKPHRECIKKKELCNGWYPDLDISEPV